MYDSFEAAKKEKIELWVSSNGRAYKEEHLARFDGCTHKKCECGKITEKRYIKCKDCRDKIKWQKFIEMPVKAWDGETPLVIYDTDQYFLSIEDIEDYCEHEGCHIDRLDLIICRPNYFNEIDTDYWSDVLPEDNEDLPVEMADILNDLNEVISKLPPCSWRPGDVRADISEFINSEVKDA